MMSDCRITVSQGVLEGEQCVTKTGKQYYRYLGIPYAEPPLGELRFKHPKPIIKWNGIKDARKEGSQAPQIDEKSGEFIGDEDCLYLNVATPVYPEDSSELLPVFVYIHGGGFINGSGSFRICGPEHIIEKDCLFVSMNYRLNVLGFLCLEMEDCPGNMGLEDQHVTLKWIHDNISFFGGDPNNVTLIGISAGAASVESHIVSPKTPSNLFHKAVLQSGSIINTWATETKYLELAFRLARYFGKELENTKDLYDFFNSMSAKDLVTAASKLLTMEDVAKYGSYGCFKPVTWNGNTFLNKLPIEIIKSGNYLKVPTITGFCSDEYLLLDGLFNNLPEYKDKLYEDLIPRQLKVNKLDFGQNFRDIYGILENDPSASKKCGDFITDLVFLSGIFTSTQLKLKQGFPLYFYRFSYEGKLNYSKWNRGIKCPGTCHADDQTYIGTNEVVNEDMASPRDVAVRKKLIHMWTDFAKYGDPTPRLSEEISIKWLPMKMEEFIYMEINEDLVLNRGLDEYMRRRREIWMEIYKYYQ